ncbi:MAG: ABC transporter permease [Candidatus Micrarchaeia archaeon]
MLLQYFDLAMRTFKHKPTRSWLTIIGIFVGIAAVVALVSLGQGLQNAINQQFDILGTNKITIYPGKSSFGVLGAIGTSDRLNDRDISAIQRVNGVEKAVGIMLTISETKYKDKPYYFITTGFDPNEINIYDFMGVQMTSGRELKSNDAYKVMVGYDFSTTEVFEKPIKVGDKLEINGKDFTVIGVVSKIGNPGFDRRIYITKDTFMDVFKQEGYPLILTLAKENANVTEVAENIKERLRKERGLEKGKETFTVMTSEQMRGVALRIIGLVQTIVIGIAAISLIVGGIGIMNTMYTSVLERTREIGIMKAVGARNRDIMMIFLIESGILGLVGGVIGTVVGIAIAYIVEKVATIYNIGLYITLDLVVIFGAILFSFIVGSLSGLLPALQAAKMKPAETLRYE